MRRTASDEIDTRFWLARDAGQQGWYGDGSQLEWPVAATEAIAKPLVLGF